MNYVIRRHNNKDNGGNFVRGKRAVTIDDRTGFKVPYQEMVFEPGTNYWVHRDESDKDFSLVSHPQNYGPEKLIERIGLRNPSPDTFLSVGAIVCLADLFTNTGNYVTSAGAVFVSTPGTGVSSNGLVFNNAQSSQYYIIVFQGI